ncbi:putative integral membrane protein [Rhodococcus sp. OK519]|uniref:LapA family protein n=1 Tax=Rhodococcus sp. OK519 TaxID=2135729 RepID=UPI000D3D13C4|nr:putative integral membrane protein [Rhodococcus sp. OK519]
MSENRREDPEDAQATPVEPPLDATAPHGRHEESGALTSHDAHKLGRTRAASTWTGLVIGIVVAILLLIFILQNLDSVTFELFAWEFSLPAGISLLLAAIAGALIMALAGGVRIIQIRRVAKRAASGNPPPDANPAG